MPPSPVDCVVQHCKTEHGSQAQQKGLNLDGLLSFLQKEVTSRERARQVSRCSTQGEFNHYKHHASFGKKRGSQWEDLRQPLSVQLSVPFAQRNMKHKIA